MVRNGKVMHFTASTAIHQAYRLLCPLNRPEKINTGGGQESVMSPRSDKGPLIRIQLQ